jgi:hypothetical protein
MIILLKNITGEILGNYEDTVPYISNISGEIQLEDYINLPGFTGLMQNFSRAEYTSALVVPYYFGLANQFNKAVITLEINYE